MSWRIWSSGHRWIWIATIVLSGACGYLLAPPAAAPQERRITVHARQYAYDPCIIRVNTGDTVHLRLQSEDVVHGFYLEGHDLDAAIWPMRDKVELRRPSQPGRRELVEEVTFVAGRPGKYRYRCSQTCGFLHPFMLGELIVAPNRLLPTSIGLAVGWLLGGLLYALRKGQGDASVVC